MVMLHELGKDTGLVAGCGSGSHHKVVWLDVMVDQVMLERVLQPGEEVVRVHVRLELDGHARLHICRVCPSLLLLMLLPDIAQWAQFSLIIVLLLFH